MTLMMRRRRRYEDSSLGHCALRMVERWTTTARGWGISAPWTEVSRTTGLYRAVLMSGQFKDQAHARFLLYSGSVYSNSWFHKIQRWMGVVPHIDNTLLCILPHWYIHGDQSSKTRCSCQWAGSSPFVTLTLNKVKNLHQDPYCCCSNHSIEFRHQMLE